MDVAERRRLVLERIAQLIRSRLQQPTLVVSEQTRADDVDGWDSLVHVDIILGVEKAFGVRLKAAEVVRVENVGSLIDIVLARGRL